MTHLFMFSLSIFSARVTVRLQAVNYVQESLTAKIPTAALLPTVPYP